MPPSMDPTKKAYLAKQKSQEALLLRTKMPPLRFRASELGKCKREIAYRLSGFIPRAFGARGCDYSRIGDLLHDATRIWMKNNGMKLGGLEFRRDGTVKELEAYKVTVNTPDGPVVIAMRLDGRIKLGRKWHLLELKSLGWGKLKGMREIWERTGGNMASVAGWIREHRRDILFQCHACMFGANLKSTYMMPVDRSECAVGLHSYKDAENITGGIILDWDQGIWKQVIARCRTVVRHVKAGTLPDPEFLSSSKECKNCSYTHLCHGATKREKMGMKPYQVHPSLGKKIHVKDL